jgi:hypothetical protein
MYIRVLPNCIFYLKSEPRRECFISEHFPIADYLRQIFSEIESVFGMGRRGSIKFLLPTYQGDQMSLKKNVAQNVAQPTN